MPFPVVPHSAPNLAQNRPQRPGARATKWLAPLLGLGLALASSGCLFQHHTNTNPLAAVKSDQPDKVLYDTAMKDLDAGNFTVARLDLETLLNTYPDSEYLAQAKLAIADSWYRQGGAEGYAQAEAQYRDFITFFPAMKEAAEAQLKIASIHFQQIEKPDRDPTEAEAAESALRTFLENYPTSPLRSQALQMLRETQEVLAERIDRIGEFYLTRAKQGEYVDYRPAQNRLEQVLNTYPLYSKGDQVLDDLANSYVTTSRLYAGAATLKIPVQYKGLYQANASADRARAVADFDRLIERYPLSPLTADAKKQLTALKAPIPTPTPAAIAFNRAEIAGRGKADTNQPVWMRWGLGGLLSSHPDAELARADKVGNPPLARPPAPPTSAPPGLEALLRQSLVATGAIKPTHTGPLPLGNAQLEAELTAADPAPGANSNSATDSSVAVNDPTSAATPLAFQSIPTEGADAPLDTDTPGTVSGNNNNDPNAAPATSNNFADSNVIITPNELDMENQDQILALDVHRSVPAPVDQLRKALAREHVAGNANPTIATTTSTKMPPPSAPKKSMFRRLLP